MSKPLLIITATLLAISGCSETYEKYVEGQDVYLECTENGSSTPHWYSFDTSKEGESTGYYWRPSNPMKRFELKDVFIKPSEITFKEDSNRTTFLNRKNLTMGYKWSYQCFSAGYKMAKYDRERRLEKLIKDNKI